MNVSLYHFVILVGWDGVFLPETKNDTIKKSPFSLLCFQFIVEKLQKKI